VKGERVLQPQAQRTLATQQGRCNITVSWLGIVPGVANLLEFNIYQSLGGKTYEKIGSTTIDSFQATNVEVLPGVDYWYKICYVESGGQESDLGKAIPVSLYSWDEDGLSIFDRMSRAQQLKSNWILEKWGENGIIYVRKFAGERCPTCYDPDAEVPTKAMCPVCFGTGYKDGYLRFDKRLVIEMGDARLTHRAWGLETGWAPRVNIDYYPILHSSDFVVRQDNSRFLLTTVNPYKIRNLLLQQTAMMVQAQPDSVAYILP
jgi:hypothetical protein